MHHHVDKSCVVGKDSPAFVLQGTQASGGFQVTEIGKVSKGKQKNKSADAKTKKKDSIPALAGNFQDRDEIELTILYRDAMPDTDVAEGSKKKQSSSSKKKKKNQSKGSASDGKRIVVYSTSNRKVGTDRSEGRDEMDSPRLPPGCT